VKPRDALTRDDRTDGPTGRLPLAPFSQRITGEALGKTAQSGIATKFGIAAIRHRGAIGGRVAE
jgi:hypothetical protein